MKKFTSLTFVGASQVIQLKVDSAWNNTSGRMKSAQAPCQHQEEVYEGHLEAQDLQIP